VAREAQPQLEVAAALLYQPASTSGPVIEAVRDIGGGAGDPKGDMLFGILEARVTAPLRREDLERRVMGAGGLLEWFGSRAARHIRP
jgi:hypothetical protein